MSESWSTSPRRAGLTLVELVISLALVSLVMAACGSVILLASHALGKGAAAGSALVDADGLALQVGADLATALTVTEDGEHAVTMTVPDRDADGTSETIRYWWTGVSGSDVLRQINAEPPAVVARDVRRFDLTYVTQTFVE